MVQVKPGAKVITIVPAQDAYGNISIVKPVFKVITIEPSADALSMEEVDNLFITAFEHSRSCVLTEALGRILVGWEEVAPSVRMDWAGFEFASSVFWR